MKVAVARQAGEPFSLETREVPRPGAGEVLVKVHACGLCHSDAFVREGHWPGIEMPRVPGHEVVGVIESIGAGVEGWTAGERVGVGWHGGHCFTCDRCRRGDFPSCRNGLITGISRDGGYAEYATVRSEGLVRVPEGMDLTEAAPLLCAGITVFNALRNSSARPGDLVAVQGIGGLGHLALQCAAKMGFHVVALSRGRDKEALARELGAHDYVDTEAHDPGAALLDLGGASVMLATAPHAESISKTVGGLAVDGELLIVAAPFEPLAVGAIDLISGRRRVQGWPSGAAPDAEDTLKFCARTGVRARVERFPLEQANEAYQHMITNAARFRAVLTMA